MRCRWRSAITRRALTAAKAWLESLCGDYAPLRRQFIAAYLRFIAAQIEAHRADLAERVKPYDGLLCAGGFSVVGTAAVAARLGADGRCAAAGGHGVLGRCAGNRHRTVARGRPRSRRRSRRQGFRYVASSRACSIGLVRYCRRMLPALLARPGAAVEPIPPRHPTGCPGTVIVRACHCERSETISIPLRTGMEIAASLRSSQ